MLKHISHSAQLFTLLSVGFLLIISTFMINFEWPDGLSYANKFIFLNRFITDFLLLCAALVLLQSGKRPFHFLGMILAFVFTLAYFIQSQSFAVSGRYLPAVALENADHVDFLPLNDIILAGVVWFGLFCLVYAITLSRVGQVPLRAALISALLILLCAAVVKNDKDWLSDQTREARFQFYNSGQAGVQHKSPLGELANSYKDYLAYLRKQNFITTQADILSEQGAEFAYQNFKYLGDENPEYPLLRKTRFDTPVDFLPEEDSAQRKNIVVFFAEGISAKLLQPYHDYFDGLTPNITEFSEQAVQIDNYHNHTYATYRALGGQLCSIYPVGRLYQQVNYRCLGHELQAAGYQNHFFVSQRLDKTDLDTVLSKTGFENVYGVKKLLELAPDPDRAESGVLPDRNLFTALIESLKEMESAEQAQPFSMGVYNFETHNGIQLMEAEASYVGAPDNRWLDTFHNFDRQFGRFWAYFKQSPFYQNTVVILTTDHATYPSKDYIRQLESRDVKDYTAIFIDDIPMLIYYPGADGNDRYDALGASSIDFAPSILHLLGIKETNAPFLGQSIFEERSPSPLAGLAGSGDHILFKNHNNDWANLSTEQLEKLNPLDQHQAGRYEFIRYAESLERSNHLWP